MNSNELELHKSESIRFLRGVHSRFIKIQLEFGANIDLVNINYAVALEMLCHDFLKEFDYVLFNQKYYMEREWVACPRVMYDFNHSKIYDLYILFDVLESYNISGLCWFMNNIFSDDMLLRVSDEFNLLLG